MKRLIGTTVFCLLAISGAFAQHVEHDGSCATYRAMEEAFKQQPELREAYYASQLLKNSKVTNMNKSADSVHFRIPVVFHIVHEYGSENISDSEVYSEMEIINKHFNAMDPDSVNVIPEFLNLIGNAHIEFVLASVDPQGNCTNGIDHIYNHETGSGDDFSKLNQWNRSNYLNIWCVDFLGTPGAAAYAFFPSSTDGYGFWRDGIISNVDYINGNGDHTITHEIGHYLALPHVFGDSDLINAGPTICNDDAIEDTPRTRGHSGCPSGYPGTWMDCGLTAIEDTLGTYYFDDVTPSTGMVDNSPVPAPQMSATDTTISMIYSPFTAVGVGANPTTTGSFGFDGWDTGATDGETVYANLTGSINTNKYYEFTVIPEWRHGMTFDELVFDVARDAEGPRTYAVRWDVDGFANNLNLNPADITNPNITANATDDVFFYNQDNTTTESGTLVDLGSTSYNSVTPVTFRIYAYNAENATGDFVVDNVMINGTFSVIENVQNIMDYSGCVYHFTPGQVDVMKNTLIEIAGQRNILHLDSTLLATGTDYTTFPDVLTTPQSALTVPLCTPVADFNAVSSNPSPQTTRNACVGNPITFEDASWNAVIDNWEWTFEDGTQTGGSTQNPEVTFNSSGYKTVTLTVSNATGSHTETRNNYIYVSDTWGDFTGPQTITLDAGGYANWFIVNNFENNWGRFSLTSGTGVNGSNAFKLNTYKDVANADFANDDFFYNNRLANTRDELITPSFDLRNTTGIEVSFDFSYATNATSVDDITEKLIVYTSTDCGETWTPKTTTVEGAPQPGGIDEEYIVTAGFAGSSDFTPTTNGEWSTASFTYTPTSADDHTRFKIQFIASDFSSNLYIDNFAVTGTLNLTSEEIALLDLNVFPNPTTTGNAINVSYTAQEEPVTFVLRDAQGKLIAQEVIDETNTLINKTLDGTQDLRSACYFLEVTIGDHTTTRKVIVL